MPCLLPNLVTSKSAVVEEKRGSYVCYHNPPWSYPLQLEGADEYRPKLGVGRKGRSVTCSRQDIVKINQPISVQEPPHLPDLRHVTSIRFLLVYTKQPMSIQRAGFCCTSQVPRLPLDATSTKI